MPARPSEPSSSTTSTSTVGLPRLSRISRPMMSTMAVMGASWISGVANLRLALLLQQAIRLEKVAQPRDEGGGIVYYPGNGDLDVKNAQQIVKILGAAARPRGRMAAKPRRGAARPGAQSAAGHRLRGAVHRAGIHLPMPRDRPAGLCPSDDRLRARPVAAGVEIPETLCRQLSQSR